MIQKGITFKKREEPDFEIIYKDKIYYIECTSCHVSNGTDLQKNMTSKLYSRINDKYNKKYNDINCTLFIDTTNIFISFIEHYGTGDEKYKEIVNDYITRINTYNSIVLTDTVFRRDTEVFQDYKLRFDNTHITLTLSTYEFLNLIVGKMDGKKENFPAQIYSKKLTE